MTTPPATFLRPLTVRVKEPSPGLFFWIVTQPSAQEHSVDVCIDTSDHPYPSYEAAMCVGMACLKAYQAAANVTYSHPPCFLPFKEGLHKSMLGVLMA